jgi:ribosomal protein S18 acetylase RimI-like enzyme
MEHEVAIRRARDDDVALLRELNREVQALHAAAEPRQFKPVVTETAPFAAMVADPEGHTFIAEVGGTPAGYCATKVVRRPENPFTYAATVVYIDQIGVLGGYQRHGVGVALINRAKTLAAELRADRVALDVWSFNTGAQDFFAAQGFVPYNHRLRLEL